MKSNTWFRIAFWTLWSIIVGICAFFIVYKAQWGLGDDAIIMRHTGFGIPFSPSDTTIPYMGRFYPFAYLLYNVLIPFSTGQITAQSHYWLHLLMFVFLSFSLAYLLLDILDGLNNGWRYLIAFLGTFVATFRLYPQFLDCFSTVWLPYSLIGLFLLFTWLFHKKKKTGFAIVALLVINYFIYCLESHFAIPLIMGICGLLFHREATKKEKVFYCFLVGSGLLYLTLYIILILPHIKTVYDGAHGTNVSILSNAVRMLFASKILLLALLVFIVRLYDTLVNKSKYTFFDNIILTAIGYCCCCFVLRLNWTLYYNIPALITIPAICYFGQRYLKAPITAVILLALFGLYGSKLPRVISGHQGRNSCFEQVTSLANEYRAGIPLIWYAPDAKTPIYEEELREWKKSSLGTYVGWILNDPEFKLEEKVVFCKDFPGIWLDASENDLLSPDRIQLKPLGEECFGIGGITGYMIH